MDTLAALPVQALHGLVYGMLLFLVASGLTLIFGMMGVLNFAHGALYMLGAYFSWSILQWTGQFWLSLLVAPLLVALGGVLIERFCLRKVHSYGHAHELLLTFGMAYIIEELVKIFWGNEPLRVLLPSLLAGSIPLLGIEYPVYRLFILAVSIIVFIIMFFVLYKTRAGIIVRASVANKQMVDALGFNVPLVFLVLFGMGAWLAGLAGVIGGPYLITNPAMASTIIIDLFVVVVVGGLGSIQGALIASLLIGQLQSIGILILPQFAIFFEFLLMALVLIFRPHGLMGESK
ncbi:MAG: branched-chain amino acid ABC transporter permease [Desulfarculaceae bacterium]|nr:branched-chain amino acid ABC transporter permease [Desulfarculaceae bacterium]MCF8047162.1 branched-chain amino acid ABC transporter permease [Desulfarculaceae bacterium]MCF8064333.1 branched-chain amino acid ABC transporter permease [Desulfarculaceae bacterium]MCF8096763.1 branched-chain amino acid ABC transporter permease [Desulfarculaceae bacterium]MCF8121444.1 branched-chain amino acid ABC transporter permease [Desulfarculaceae bacterium]